MKPKVIPSTMEFASLISLPILNACSLKKSQRDQTASLIVLSTSVTKNLLKSQSFGKISKGRKVRRSCSSNLGEFCRDESHFHLDGLIISSGETGSEEKKSRCVISERNSPFDTRFDFLEPMMLGVRHEFADRPDQETAVWATIEQKAKSLDIPLSLRMIKKKLQCEESFVEPKESVYCSVKTAFASMVFIIVALQSYALQMREALCHEDLDVIITKVQKEMNSSFVWLFQQVFSRTPVLMLHVMILLADFSVYSSSNYVPAVETSEPGRDASEATSEKLVIGETLVIENTLIDDDQLDSVAEMNLWTSMVEEEIKMREDVEGEVEMKEALNHEMMQHFVSPVSINLEPDKYEDYSRTDLLYQMNLSFEPNNPLLLCNYAQFLHLVAHDYDRAEECFKRAVQIPPPDAECLSLYANFLWTVRRDVWGAEERFLQALAVEPESSYYASRYANFLWNTGGEETCFPPNPNS